MHSDLPQLSNIQTLNVEEFAISLEGVQRIGNFAVPPFIQYGLRLGIVPNTV